VCRELGIPLAEECPNQDKAFGPSTKGTVLGLKFDSVRMTWSLSEEKRDGVITMIDQFLLNRTCTLGEIQKLHGKLSDFAQACDFMTGFRFNVVNILQKFDLTSTGAKLRRPKEISRFGKIASKRPSRGSP
jgi:hypothetical protein